MSQSVRSGVSRKAVFTGEIRLPHIQHGTARGSLLPDDTEVLAEPGKDMGAATKGDHDQLPECRARPAVENDNGDS